MWWSSRGTERREVIRILMVFGSVSVWALAACSPSSGSAAGSAGGTTTVQVTANNYKFQSSTTSFKENQPYQFEVRNTDTVAHEFLIMPRGETDPSKKLAGVLESDLQPGKTATVSYMFTTPGNYEFACHIPGHYEAGMVLPITVS
jgi:uncharacterized cupredoxin-like copper-binding protein